MQWIGHCQPIGLPAGRCRLAPILFIPFPRNDAQVVAEEQDNDGEDARLAKLASFQLMMIRHAMKCTGTSLYLQTLYLIPWW